MGQRPFLWPRTSREARRATPTLRTRSPERRCNPSRLRRPLLDQRLHRAEREGHHQHQLGHHQNRRPSAATSAPAAVGSLDPRLVGHWTFKGADEPRFTFAKKGKVKMTLGTQRCLGKWSTTPVEELLVEYDPNQSGCSRGSSRA